VATSSKVKFKLDVLRQKAIESIDYRISQAELEVASFDDDEAFSERVRQWREDSERRLSEIFSQLGEIDDYRLSKFRLAEIPTIDRYARRSAERVLEDLKVKRSRVIAKSESLVPDEDGNISLTKTQLSEFFGL